MPKPRCGLLLVARAGVVRVGRTRAVVDRAVAAGVLLVQITGVALARIIARDRRLRHCHFPFDGAPKPFGASCPTSSLAGGWTGGDYLFMKRLSNFGVEK